ncbi:fimbrial protein [Pseudomonas sp. D1HM]|uniref:fimbrial protein n=1 Tax=Pseudomonas sp. D1HM TaxID=1784816 RepID=UPI001C4FC581|nr:hypothetical protein [Pseudomonas sp. D1HM]
MKNKSIIAMTLAAAAAGMISSSAFAADGVINFTGEIKNATCEVGTGGTQAINVPAIAKDNLSGSGSTGPSYGFNIELSGADCTGTNVQLSFEQDPNTIDPDGTLVNTDPTTGASVTLELLDSFADPINLADATYKTRAVPITNNTAKIPLRARYKAKTDTVVAGPVIASVGVLVETN